jgi:hypothetical protein
VEDESEAQPWRARPALIVSIAIAGLVFGAGSLLPLWWVPSWGVPVVITLDGQGPTVLIRSGALWDAIAGTARLPQLGERPWWVYENACLTLVLLAASLGAGLFCYWVIRAVSSSATCSHRTGYPRPWAGHNR